MAARATVYQNVQIGLESTSGVLVPATKRLTNFGMTPTPNIPIKKVQYPGSKAAIGVVKAQEYTEAKFMGNWDFTTLMYIFNSIFGNPTTTNPGILSYQRTWAASPTNPIVPNTYTFEQGSARGAERFGFGFFNDITMKWTKEDATLEGSIIGQQLLRDQSMTSGVSSLPINLCQAYAIGIWISLDLGNTWTRLSKNLEGDFKFGALRKPVFHVSDLNVSFDDTVEIAPDFQVSLTTEEGSEADTFMSNLENETPVYLGIQVQGPSIETVADINYYNLLKVKMPTWVTKPAPGDKSGVWGNTFTFDLAHDDTFGMANILLINALAAL